MTFIIFRVQFPLTVSLVNLKKKSRYKSLYLTRSDVTEHLLLCRLLENYAADISKTLKFFTI